MVNSWAHELPFLSVMVIQIKLPISASPTVKRVALFNRYPLVDFGGAWVSPGCQVRPSRVTSNDLDQPGLAVLQHAKRLALTHLELRIQPHLLAQLLSGSHLNTNKIESFRCINIFR